MQISDIHEKLLTEGGIVGVKILRGHELRDEGRFADAGGTEHDDPEGRVADAAGARLSGAGE